MGKRRNALGRGLDALIPVPEPAIREAALDDIVPNRHQPRKRFDEDKLAELARSIEMHGVLQPLIVSPPDSNGRRRLIVGERRWQAARMAGLDSVPVVERESAAENSAEIALVENIQRQDLDPLEEAAALEALIREHGLTQDQAARRIGRSRSAVANSLRLLTLPSPVREALVEGAITEGHARALLAVTDASEIERILRRVVDDGLSVRRTESLVAGLKDGRTTRVVRGPRERRPELRSLEDQLRQSFGTKVSVLPGRNRGRIVIEYYSQDDLSTLLDRLLDSERIGDEAAPPIDLDPVPRSSRLP